MLSAFKYDLDFRIDEGEKKRKIRGAGRIQLWTNFYGIIGRVSCTENKSMANYYGSMQILFLSILRFFGVKRRNILIEAFIILPQWNSTRTKREEDEENKRGNEER